MAPSDTDIKSRILHAAKKLFAKQGFDGTSVRQICEEAGANVALVSYHFGGKENVFYAVFETFFPGEDIVSSHGHLLDEPVSGLSTIIEEVIRFRAREPELIMMLQQEIFKNSPRMDKIKKYALPVWGLLRDVLQKGKETGVFHFRSLDNTLFFVMGTMLFHKQAEYFKPLIGEEPPTIEVLVSDTQEFVLQGLCYNKGGASTK